MERMTIHITNLIIGVIITAIGCFMAWVVLAFAPEGNDAGLLMLPSLLLVWLIIYIGQIIFPKIWIFILTLCIEFVLFYMIVFHSASWYR
ncbi:hypothetical protein [Heyndrickxia acidiproducens]|jgi:hypothetical protein|uniref:hypothetical protein n=1 Tax=Heyndrickxia acidiproducens TaxID=1121084 RepID=UPI00037B2991|nr:hypothetical protein [Heyndrickxia acidiproducens]